MPDADWMQVEQLVGMFTDFYDGPARPLRCWTPCTLPHRKLRTLSKGNKEKVQLILAMSRAALYLLDEPIGGVDPPPATTSCTPSSATTARTQQSSVTLIGDIEAVLDRAIFLKDGRVFAHRSSGAPRD